MMTRQIGGAMLALFATAAIAAAQDKPMPMDKKMDKMDKKMEQTLTGCVMKSDSGVFTLDHAMAADMNKGLKKDSRKKDTMTTDSTMKDSLPMTPELTSKSVDLSQHVGHKVSVTGADDMTNGKTMFTVKSLKMIGSSCS